MIDCVMNHKIIKNKEEERKVKLELSDLFTKKKKIFTQLVLIALKERIDFVD